MKRSGSHNIPKNIVSCWWPDGSLEYKGADLTMTNPRIASPGFSESCQWLLRQLEQGEFYETPVEWVINNMIKDGKPVGFKKFPFCVDLLNDQHPRQIWKKGSQ